MRYHLWTVLSSRAGPYGVLDSGAVTGAARPVPYCAHHQRFGRLLQGVFTAGSSPPLHQTEGSLRRLPAATVPFRRSMQYLDL